jgi:hypothetical protein
MDQPTSDIDKGKEKDKEKIAIDFIDPLFAVVLHISFVEIKEQHWFLNFWCIFQKEYFFEFITIILAYFTIVTSWVGYHRSIKENPISVKNPWGRGRFYTDIMLLIAYFVLVVSFSNFRRELWVLVVIFLLFFLWDQFKRKERGETEESRARRGVTVFWFFIFLLFALFYTFHPPSVRNECEDWLILLAALLATILYRAHKEHLVWKPLLLVLGFPKSNG